jgi:tRNA pseudouridine55 synthase
MDFIINLNKPKGITSQQAISKVKKILKAKKAGHTGTLDPEATGVLLVCINRATRFASYFSSLNKEYRAVMKLGETTDTQDAQGNIIEKSDRVECDETLIKRTLKSFEGEILQKPPMFSALKHRGKPLYKYAHKGIDIPRKYRTVHIYNIKLLGIDIPYVSLSVVCSKGTYIRTLCNDIGKKLGFGAHLYELERTAIATFGIQDSLGIEELIDKVHYGKNRISPEVSSSIFTIDRAISWMPELKIKESLVKSVLNGHPIHFSQLPDLPDSFRTAPAVKIKSPGNDLLAVAIPASARNVLKMNIVLAPLVK